MNTKFYFDFRDIFRAGRLGFKGKKMMIHFLGLMLGYLIYEALTYLSLISSGAGGFWAKYGLRPVCLFEGSASGLPAATKIVMAIGCFIWVIIYYLFSTAASKVAVEELRGDDFYSMKAAIKFACKRWKSIFVTMLALVFIFIFCLFFPSLVGLLDLIPGVEQAAEHAGTPITTFLTIPVYFMGLFMVLVILALLFGLLLIPAIVAVTGEDVFETVYQLFSTIWNQPWRLIVYGSLLKAVICLGAAVFAALSVVGMCIAFLPSTLLANQDSYYFADVIARSLRIVGVSPDVIGEIPGASSVSGMPWTLDIATFFLFASLIMVAAIVVSYPLSIISSGTTILYVILRKKTSDEDMLEVEEEEEMDLGTADEPEEETAEKSAEAEEETEEEE
ncbi:hypothetical protein ACFL6S_16685 [Candidatus Poribacteria bacterium]